MDDPRTDANGAEPEVAIDPRDIASAGRSCSVILILLAAIVLVLCVGIALRWVFLS